MADSALILASRSSYSTRNLHLYDLTSTRLRLQSFVICLDNKPRVETSIRRNLVEMRSKKLIALSCFFPERSFGLDLWRVPGGSEAERRWWGRLPVRHLRLPLHSQHPGNIGTIGQVIKLKIHQVCYSRLLNREGFANCNAGPSAFSDGGPCFFRWGLVLGAYRDGSAWEMLLT